MILSIDVGWKHLAYCLMLETNEIQEWEIINLCNEDVNVNTLSIELLIETCKKGIEKFVNEKSLLLNSYQLNEKKDAVVFIEAQPMGPFTKNIKTKILSHILQYLFSLQNFKVQFISSKKKLKSVVTEKLTYQKLKKKAIEHATELLDEKWKKYFLNFKGKKDDLADCFLQGYYGKM